MSVSSLRQVVNELNWDLSRGKLDIYEYSELIQAAYAEYRG